MGRKPTKNPFRRARLGLDVGTQEAVERSKPDRAGALGGSSTKPETVVEHSRSLFAASVHRLRIGVCGSVSEALALVAIAPSSARASAASHPLLAAKRRYVTTGEVPACIPIAARHPPTSRHPFGGLIGETPCGYSECMDLGIPTLDDMVAQLRLNAGTDVQLAQRVALVCCHLGATNADPGAAIRTAFRIP